MGTLFAALLWVAAVDAQVASSATAPVVGHAPEVTIEVSNETVPGQPPAAGHMLRAQASAVDPDGDTITGTTYRWLRGSTEIGTNPTYTTVVADADLSLTVEATATTDPATTDPASGTGTLAVAVGTNSAPVASDVAIEGTVAVDELLTGSFTYSDAAGDVEGTHEYQWYRADDAMGTSRTAISGATETTYTIVAADQGKYLVFEVTPKSTTGTPDTGTAASAVTATAVPAAASPPEARNVRITGKTMANGQAPIWWDQVGEFDYFDADGDAAGTHQYRWYLADDEAGTNITPIAAATTSTINVAPSYQGKYLVFEVTPTSATGDTGSPVQAVKRVDSYAVANNLSITGPLMIGQTVSAGFDFQDADGDSADTHRYSWYRSSDADGTNRSLIPGEGLPTYAIGGADVGMYLLVEVTPVSWNGEWTTDGIRVMAITPTKVSASGSGPPAATAVTISGDATVGRTLMGAYTYSDADGDAEGTSTFRWFRDGVAVAGATEKSYLLTVADEGKILKFEVTPVSATGSPSGGEPVQSAETAVVQPKVGAAPVASEVKVTGSPTIGSVLTATFTYSDADGDAPGTHVYHWTRLKGDYSGAEQISGATEATYTVANADLGSYLIVTVTPKSATGTPNTGLAEDGATEEVVTGTPVDLAPVATDVKISGNPTVGTTLMGVYTYGDLDGDVEGASTFRWFRDGMAIPGATVKTFVVTPGELGKTLKFEVTPVSATGMPNTGNPVQSGDVRVFVDGGIFEVGNMTWVSPMSSSKADLYGPGYSEFSQYYPPTVSYDRQEAAATYCENLAYGGFSDWRLPSADELLALYAAYPNKGIVTVLNWGIHEGGSEFPFWSSTKDGPTIDVLIGLEGGRRSTNDSRFFNAIGHAACIR